MNKKKGLRRFFTLDVHNHEGFTLVELIIVIAILAILSTGAIAGYSAYVQKANKAADDALISEINTAFRAACIDNYCDIFDVENAKITVTDGVIGALTLVKVNDENNSDIIADFATYFNTTNAKLKYYKRISFNSTLHQFIGEISAFDNHEVMAGIENAFNNISDVLLGYDSLTEEEIRSAILGDFDANLAGALGMAGMLDGYLKATELEGDELKAALEQYCPEYAALETDEEKENWIANNADKIAQLKANLGVMHFASSAKTDDPDHLLDKVMNSLDKIVAAVHSGEQPTNDQIWAYYCSTPRGIAKITEVGEAAARTGDFVDFRGYSYMLGMTGDDLVRVSNAIENGTTNEAGINTLGALYALAAGYYNNSTYWKDDIPPMGEFPSVVKAMIQSNFMTYYTNQARVDIEAYLTRMGMLADKNMDLTQSGVFDNVFTGN